MSTRSLLVWIALVTGVEFALRGHLANRGWLCHGGALLFALGLAGLVWPTRARRAGIAVATGLALLVGFDASWAAWREAPPAGAGEKTVRAEGGVAAALESRFRCPDEVATLDVSEPARRWRSALEAGPRLALVYGGERVLDEVLASEPALRRARGERSPERGSPLVAALVQRWRRGDAEQRWREARDAALFVDPARSRVAARYREALLAARRSGAEVLLLVDAPTEGEPAATPEARGRWLAERAHLRLVRGVAGAYGLRVVEVDPGLGALRERLGDSGAGCRELGSSEPAASSVSGSGSGRTA